MHVRLGAYAHAHVSQFVIFFFLVNFVFVFGFKEWVAEILVQKFLGESFGY